VDGKINGRIGRILGYIQLLNLVLIPLVFILMSSVNTVKADQGKEFKEVRKDISSLQTEVATIKSNRWTSKDQADHVAVQEALFRKLLGELAELRSDVKHIMEQLKDRK
jgi:Fic family protein